MQSILLTTALLLAPPDAFDRLSAPDAQAIAQATAEIQQEFRQEYQRADTSAQRVSLANQLLRRAAGTAEPPVRFVLLDEARRLAADAGKLDLAMKALTVLRTEFAVDSVLRHAETLAALAAVEPTPSGNFEIGSLALNWQAQALLEERFDLARRLVQLGKSCAARSNSPQLTAAVAQAENAIAAAEQAAPAIRAAEQRLKTDPLRQQDNEAVGKFHGLQKGDWDRAMPYLAFAAPDELARLAEQDLKRPTEAAEQSRLADGWWDLAAKAQGLEQLHLRARAAHWYSQAVRKLSGLSRTKAENRIRDARHFASLVADTRSLSEASTLLGPLNGRTAFYRPRLRDANGGTQATQAAVNRALKWMLAQQNDDGGWRYKSPFKDKTPHLSQASSTAIVLLCLLAEGNTHHAGTHQEAFHNGLRLLLRLRERSRKGSTFRDASFWYHDMATLVLVETYVMTGDPNLRSVYDQAIEFAANRVHDKEFRWTKVSELAWRLSVTRAAELGGLNVPEVIPATVRELLPFAQTPDGHYFDSHPKTVRDTTEMGLWCRHLLGNEKQDPRFRQGIDFVVQRGPQEYQGDLNFFATQLLFSLGGDDWVSWNAKLQKLLVDNQEPGDDFEKDSGSWSLGKTNRSGGRLLETAFNCLSLQVYYRYPRRAGESAR